MDCFLSYSTLFSSSLPRSFAFPVKTPYSSSSCSPLSFSFSSSGNFALGLSSNVPSNRRRNSVVVACSNYESGESGLLNAPLPLKSYPGSYLTGLLLNGDDYFLPFAESFLQRLANDRRRAVQRINLNSDPESDEALFRRMVGKVKLSECQTAVEDIMYMLICHRFHGIRVHMLPNISKCIYNGRLEILPSKYWELESIHSFEVLDMVKEHTTALVGGEAYSSVINEWKRTQISQLELNVTYTASILYGYLIKSASLRLSLEGLSEVNLNADKGIVIGQSTSRGSTSVGEVSHNQEKRKRPESLRCYLMNFDSEMLQMCAKPKSKEAENLIERHAFALFADEKAGVKESNKLISTSYATLKRYVLEGIAFGCFLWDAEAYVNGLYELEENSWDLA